MNTKIKIIILPLNSNEQGWKYNVVCQKNIHHVVIINLWHKHEKTYSIF